MSVGPILSLTEALTDLAFGHPTPASTILSASGGGRIGHTRSDALNRLAVAAHILCDAGYSGEVKLWGKKTTSSTGIAPPEASIQQLTQADYLQFRRIALGYDVLWSGKNKGDEFNDFFAAEVSEICITELCVDRADFSRFLAAHRHTKTAAKPSAAMIAPTTKKPRLPQPKLKHWWEKLSDKERDLPRDELHKRCVAEHPGNSIARARIRDLAPQRKPGPRPIRPDSTA